MEQRISIERMEQAVNLFGSFDENVRLIESEFKVTISNREGELRVNGEVEDTMLAVKALNALLTISNRGEPITEQNVRYVISLVRAGQEDRISELTQDVICISSKGRPIKPKTIGQKKYIESVLKNTITIGVGPAGTGKTYLAVAAAVAAQSRNCRSSSVFPGFIGLGRDSVAKDSNFDLSVPLFWGCL
jgi:phosphate starvation-inducible PhoH-like protein